MAEEQKPSTPPSSETPAASTPNSNLTSRTGTPNPSVDGDGSLAEKMAAPDGKVQDDSSKLRTFLSILKRFIGVSDIAAVRISLPAQLMEPVPNLEYWNYCDRPEQFAAIGDSDDELERMLGCLRFWFTKDLKYVKGKPCKPYNSTLGEFFRCTWNVDPSEQPAQSTETKTDDTKADDTKTSETKTADMPNGDSSNKPLKVIYLTEQTSHHPPVSAYVYECPDKGIIARGYDQLSAKFTGTSVRVTPGQYNKGIFITLSQREDEEYELTHPAAYLCGFLRGNLYVSVSDTCTITCRKTGIKVLLTYLEDGFFGKTQNKVEGVIYKCDVDSDDTTKISNVPDKNVLGRIDGCWKDKIYFAYGSTPWKKVSDSDKVLLMDVTPLEQAEKICPPYDDQLLNESRRFWKSVTEAILAKQYSTATQKKIELEETQRNRATRRKTETKTWNPRFFTTMTEENGRPQLSEIGKTAIQGLYEGNYHLEVPEEYGAM